MADTTRNPEAVDWGPVALLAPLLVYPTRELPSQLPDLRAALLACREEISPALAGSLERLKGLSFHELEELYTQIFDLNPVCTLEVGWHLYGEQYERGRFLVRTRDLLMKVGLDEAGELPDFLPSLLLALPRLETEEAAGFASYLIPALRKMCDAFDDEEKVGDAAVLYLPILCAIRDGLEARVSEEAILEVEQRFRPQMVGGRVRGIDPGPNGDFPLNIASDPPRGDGIVKLGVEGRPKQNGAVHGVPIGEIPMGGKRS